LKISSGRKNHTFLFLFFFPARYLIFSHVFRKNLTDFLTLRDRCRNTLRNPEIFVTFLLFLYQFSLGKLRALSI